MFISTALRKLIFQSFPLDDEPHANGRVCLLFRGVFRAFLIVFYFPDAYHGASS